MKKVLRFISVWGFPFLFGFSYWIFDALIGFINPPVDQPTLIESVFPKIHSLEFLFRTLMTIITIFGARAFERTVVKLNKLEQQLYLSEYAVENTTAFWMMWINSSGRLIKVNRYAAEKLGYTKPELLSKTIFDITPGYTIEQLNKMVEELKKGEVKTYLTKYLAKDGSLIESQVYLQYLNHKKDQYQFAFVCDAFQCPVTPYPQVPACGRRPAPKLPTEQVVA